jgi:flagellar FliJ protein
MKKNALLHLIELARRARDDAAQRVAGAHHEVSRARNTLDTLATYRQEQWRAAAQRSRTDPALLRIRDVFGRKLDGAIAEQRATCDTLHEALERQRLALNDRQRRLLAWETMQARRDAADAERQRRTEQRATDEQAARMVQRRNRGV